MFTNILENNTTVPIRTEAVDICSEFPATNGHSEMNPPGFVIKTEPQNDAGDQFALVLLEVKPEDLSEDINVNNFEDNVMHIEQEQPASIAAVTTPAVDCHLCRIPLETEGQLLQHFVAAHPAYRYHCVVCRYSTKKEVDRIRHLTKHQNIQKSKMRNMPKVIKTRSEFACSICHMEFVKHCELVVHLSKAHKQNHECPMCGEVYATKSRLLAHICVNHPEEDPPPSGAPTISYECYFCGSRAMKTKGALTAHMLIAHPLLDCYSCEECGFSSENVLTFNEHLGITRHKGNRRPYRCRVCHQRFTTSANAIDHEVSTHRRFKSINPPSLDRLKEDGGTENVGSGTNTVKEQSESGESQQRSDCPQTRECDAIKMEEVQFELELLDDGGGKAPDEGEPNLVTASTLQVSRVGQTLDFQTSVSNSFLPDTEPPQKKAKGIVENTPEKQYEIPDAIKAERIDIVDELPIEDIREAFCLKEDSGTEHVDSGANMEAEEQSGSQENQQPSDCPQTRECDAIKIEEVQFELELPADGRGKTSEAPGEGEPDLVTASTLQDTEPPQKKAKEIAENTPEKEYEIPDAIKAEHSQIVDELHIKDTRKVFSPRKIYGCYLCDTVKPLASEKALRLHLTQAHAEKVLYHCRKCNIYLTEKVSFNRHLCQHDASSRTVKCRFCPLMFTNDSLVKQHELKHHWTSLDSATKIKALRAKAKIDPLS